MSLELYGFISRVTTSMSVVRRFAINKYNIHLLLQLSDLFRSAANASYSFPVPNLCFWLRVSRMSCWVYWRVIHVKFL